jgi:hypothetical protein
MPRLFVIAAWIGAAVAWAVRSMFAQPGAPPGTSGPVGLTAQDDVWRGAEWETTALRTCSGPGPM